VLECAGSRGQTEDRLCRDICSLVVLMSILQRYNKIILTIAAIVVVPSAVYGGVLLRDEFGSPTYHSTKTQVVDPVPVKSVSIDRRRAIQDELQALLKEREEVQHKIDEVKNRITKQNSSPN